MLDELIGRQAPDRARLIETCELSRSALARASFCSRRHVDRLLKDGQALGLLRLEDRRLTAAPELSDDVERHYAGVFAVARTVALAALAEA
jgi:AraC-like DNA-binding protein